MRINNSLIEPQKHRGHRERRIWGERASDGIGLPITEDYHETRMKTILHLIEFGVACLVIMYVLHRSEDVWVTVNSYDIEGRRVLVHVQYLNELHARVVVDFDLRLIQDYGVDRYGRTGLRSIKTEHFSGVRLAPDEEREDLVAITLPPKFGVGTPVVRNVVYRRLN